MPPKRWKTLGVNFEIGKSGELLQRILSRSTWSTVNPDKYSQEDIEKANYDKEYYENIL